MRTKVRKKTFISDTFEQIADTGVGSAKQSMKAVKQTFDPFSKMPESKGMSQSEKMSMTQREILGKKDNHTPIDLKELEKKYDDQDKKKQDVLRQRLFKLVSEGTELAYHEKDKKMQEKKRDEEKEEQDKKKAQAKRRSQDEGAIPRGKQRRSILSPKKKAQQQHTEYKPSAGHG